MKDKPSYTKWSCEELTLALDFYFKYNPLHISVGNTKITQLCQEINNLNDLSYNIGISTIPIKRTPNSVYMKLCNFLRLDPNYSGAGLSKGSRLEEEIWNKYYGNIPLLSDVAGSLIRLTEMVPDSIIIGNFEEIDSSEYREGAILFSFHKRYERSQKAVQLKKANTKNNAGKLICEICGFCFEDAYGTIGKDFIECHHIVPLSKYGEIDFTCQDNLILVCANCHRMLHRNIETLSPEDLRKKVVARK